MTMHLDNRFSTINTKKYKAKITKGKLKELELRWRQHNKRMKQSHMHHLRYDTLQEYIDYCYGKAYKKPDPRDYRHFTKLKPDSNWRVKHDEEHREKLKSMGPRLAGRLDSEKEFTDQFGETQISKHIVDCMNDFIETQEKWHLFYGNKQLKILSCWINDMKEGEYNPPHTHHDNTGWSSVLFLILFI